MSTITSSLGESQGYPTLHSARVLAFRENVLFSCVCCVCQSCTVYGDPRRGVSTVSTWLDLEEEVGKALWRILDVLTCSTTAIHTDILASSPQRPENVRGTQINMVYWVTESDKAKGLFPIGTLPLCTDLLSTMLERFHWPALKKIWKILQTYDVCQEF